MKLSSETIRNIMNAVRTTRDKELTCDHCFDELDEFIELKLRGKKATEAMPLVQEHLDRCKACREEYETLLVALEAMIN